MAVNLSALAGAGQQFFDNNGNPLSGGKLYSYEAGTTTPQATYTSASGGTAHANPIVLDSAGRVATGEIWLTAGQNYKFELKTSAEVTLATWDNITGINGTGITSNANNVEYDPPFTGALTSNYTVEEKLAQTVSVKDFGAVGDGVADDTAAIQLALDVGGGIYFPAGTYLVKDSTNTSNGVVLAPINNSVLFGDGSSTIMKLGAHTSRKHNIFRLDNKNNVTIQNMKLDGNFVNQTFPADEFSHSIRIVDGSSNCVVDNCIIVDSRGDGVYIGDETTGATAIGNGNAVRNCFLSGNTRQQISVVHAFNTDIAFNKVNGTIDIEPNVAIMSGGKVENCLIIGNTGTAGTSGNTVDTSNLIINVYNGSEYAGINKLINISIIGNSCSIIAVQSALGTVIEGNTIVGSNATQEELLRLFGTENTAITGNTFIPNESVATSLITVIENQGNKTLSVTGNSVRDASSSIRFNRFDAVKLGLTADSQTIAANSMGNGYWNNTLEKANFEVLIKLEIENSASATITSTQVGGPTCSINIVVSAGFIQINNIGGSPQPKIDLLTYGESGLGAYTGITQFTSRISIYDVDYSIAGRTRFGFRSQAGGDPTAAADVWTATDVNESATIFLRAWV